MDSFAIKNASKKWQQGMFVLNIPQFSERTISNLVCI